MSKILFFFSRENKNHVFKPTCNFYYIGKSIFELFCTNNIVKVENDVIDILTSEDMENTPLEFRM